MPMTLRQWRRSHKFFTQLEIRALEYKCALAGGRNSPWLANCRRRKILLTIGAKEVVDVVHGPFHSLRDIHDGNVTYQEEQNFSFIQLADRYVLHEPTRPDVYLRLPDHSGKACAGKVQVQMRPRPFTENGKVKTSEHGQRPYTRRNH